jgi:serine/threonine protein kinase
MHQRGLIHGDLHAVSGLAISVSQLTQYSQGNILVHERRALLTDFGLTIVGDETQSEIPIDTLPALGHGAIRWLAPELITEEGNPTPRKTMAGDMFGFGRLCLAVSHFTSRYRRSNVLYFQICTNGDLFTNVSEHSLKSKLKGGWLPSKPELLDCGDRVPMWNGLWRLAEDCWKLESEGSRPSATEALQRLQSDQIYR